MPYAPDHGDLACWCKNVLQQISLVHISVGSSQLRGHRQPHGNLWLAALCLPQKLLTSCHNKTYVLPNRDLISGNSHVVLPQGSLQSWDIEMGIASDGIALNASPHQIHACVDAYEQCVSAVRGMRQRMEGLQQPAQVDATGSFKVSPSTDASCGLPTPCTAPCFHTVLHVPATWLTRYATYKVPQRGPWTRCVGATAACCCVLLWRSSMELRAGA